MPNPWYEVVTAGTPITQGDLIMECPLLTWNAGAAEGVQLPALQQAVTAFRADVVVMTQACDLENEKVRNVILCPHVSLEEYQVAFEQALRDQG